MVFIYIAYFNPTPLIASNPAHINYPEVSRHLSGGNGSGFWMIWPYYVTLNREVPPQRLLRSNNNPTKLSFGLRVMNREV